MITSCKSQVAVDFMNTSQENYKNLRVEILGESFEFKDLKSGKKTDYIKVSKTYSYCYAYVVTEKDTLSLLPFDYIGEKLYKSGKLTIMVDITEKRGNRTLVIQGIR